MKFSVIEWIVIFLGAIGLMAIGFYLDFMKYKIYASIIG